MTLTDEEYKRVVHRAMAAFRHLPNVHSVGLGGRERAGQPTGEIVLKVFVHRKVHEDALAVAEGIPAIFEGVPTDVVEAPEPKHLLAAPPGVAFGSTYNIDRGCYRPLRGGIQIGGLDGPGLGTLGFICRIDEPPPNRIVALTCYHVFFTAPSTEVADLLVGQPTPEDSVTPRGRGVFGTFLKGYRDATMDAAAVVLEEGTEYYPQIEDIGVVNSEHAITLAEAATLTYAVRKRGRTTRLTGGTVQAIGAVHASGLSGYTVIKPNPVADGAAVTPGFADHGDSGAAVVSNAGEIVGMVFGGPAPGDSPQGYGFAWGITELKARFAADGIDLICDSSTRLNDKRVAPLAALSAAHDSQDY
jgi:hypothetical protein